MGTSLQHNLLYNICQFGQISPWAEIPYAGALVLSSQSRSIDIGRTRVLLTIIICTQTHPYSMIHVKTPPNCPHSFHSNTSNHTLPSTVMSATTRFLSVSRLLTWLALVTLSNAHITRATPSRITSPSDPIPSTSFRPLTFSTFHQASLCAVWCVKIINILSKWLLLLKIRTGSSISFRYHSSSTRWGWSWPSKYVVVPSLFQADI